MYESRNFKGGFKRNIFLGLINGFVSSWLRGKEFWNLRVYKKDSESIEKADQHNEINYPKPNGKTTFNILENLSRSDTYHESD